MNPEITTEEGIQIQTHGTKISKELKVFYNKEMKLNRDISLLTLKTYFDGKKIKYCDPMCASGIRQIRFLKTIPEIFDEIILGDISKSAISQTKNTIKNNKLSPIIKQHKIKLKLKQQNALNTLLEKFYDCIELDPFGSPVPFLDTALQRIKHAGIITITATDTAPLCGTYPKTSERKYAIKTQRTLWHEELGLRNLIAYCQKEGAKYELNLIPILSYSNKHYFRIIFQIENSRTNALNTIRNHHKYLKYDQKTQTTTICDYEEKNTFGKTYTDKLCDKNFIKKLQQNLNLIQNKKEIEKLLQKLLDEPEILAYYEMHKLIKYNKLQSNIKKETLITELKNQGYEASEPHNNPLGIKTNAPQEKIIEIMKTNLK